MRIRRFLSTGILVAAAAAVVQAQHTPDAKKPDDRPVITVTGCVEGSWLRARVADGIGSYAERYRLRGSKQLLGELKKKYDRHVLEVTGAVTDTGDSVHRGKTIQVGKKTRIFTGAKEIPSEPQANGDPELEVDSFRDLKDSCK